VPRVPLIHGRRRGFHDSANLNLAKRRLCAALGISLGSSEHCCAISVARVRAALTASIPRSNRPLARRTNFGAAKSCSLVIIFMIRPPTAQSGESNYAHRSRPYHGSRNSGDSERPTGAFNERDPRGRLQYLIEPLDRSVRIVLVRKLDFSYSSGDAARSGAHTKLTAVMMQCGERQKGAITGPEQSQQKGNSIASSAAASSLSGTVRPERLRGLQVDPTSYFAALVRGATPSGARYVS
jgi:hypothetical protein